MKEKIVEALRYMLEKNEFSKLKRFCPNEKGNLTFDEDFARNFVENPDHYPFILAINSIRSVETYKEIICLMAKEE